MPHSFPDRRFFGVVDPDPTWSLGGGLGFTALVVSNEFDTSAILNSVGPLFSWTFPNRKVARARIDKAGASARAALAGFDGAVLDALREAESALTLYARHIEQNDRLRIARDENRPAAPLQNQQTRRAACRERRGTSLSNSGVGVHLKKKITTP